MKTKKIYTQELYRQFGYLATWNPGTPMALGDIGIMRQKQFTKIGNVSDLGISFEIEEDITPIDLEFSSEGAVSVSTKLSGSPTLAGSSLSDIDAGIHVKFSKENAILFKANETRTPAIKNQIKLGEEIIELFKAGKWDKNWVVITELVTADSASILISSSKEASIDIKVSGEIGTNQLDIAEAELGLEVKFSKDLSTKFIAKTGLTPLFKVSKIKRPFLGTPIFKAKGITSMDLATPQMALEHNELFFFDKADFDFEEEVEM
ncbi:hypothetical protein [Aquimarina pacifica]|uniref:hypothetical protein n=1 Tax=Aquimarina pacifica TaxID=1296415 RepID=UPI00046EA00A|nr:hypothetical protein [Aquimarina pacifica]